MVLSSDYLAFEVTVTPLAWVGLGCPAALPAATSFWAQGPPPGGSFFGGDASWFVNLFWSGPREQDFTIDAAYQGIYTGNGLLVNAGETSAKVLLLSIVFAPGCFLSVGLSVAWRANTTDQVLRAFLDEEESPGADVWHWEVEHVPLRGAERHRVEGSGNAWVSGHARGLFYKLYTRGGARATGQRISYYLPP